MGKVRMSLVVDEALWKRLSHLAVEKGKSKNDLIIDLIEQALNKSPSIRLLARSRAYSRNKNAESSKSS